jgi:hypothetical protein
MSGVAYSSAAAGGGDPPLPSLTGDRSGTGIAFAGSALAVAFFFSGIIISDVDPPSFASGDGEETGSAGTGA